ncbi:endo-1,4-beta-xylanase [Protaetiibacter intestinalis]|uniref:Beta-xylanase n=1 Tax=Protaetiibacter intestinalis TaxID=2419774 RepID=A0A387BE29_9MICO|nr:endo-1,4-beta-xylanase [Protaetiibacter intestinalis]AYF99316.1 endo-1,4-beta-xylanase [Protaetiibacter intestinalis]
MPATPRPLLVLALASALALTACSAAEPDPPTAGPTAPADARLRDAAPEGLLVGAAVAGGGHHVDADYPDPFPNDEPYRELLASEFSSLTPENQLKWEFVHPERDRYEFGAADAIVAFAEEHGQAVRGHTLLWHSQNPDWLTEGEFSDAELRDILHEHISTVVGRYAGRIAEWDVANEIFDDSGALRSENLWILRLGEGIVADAFRWAHEADPDARLFLNDYGMESGGPKADAYLALVKELLAEGVPVGGVGFQGHLAFEYSAPGGMADNLRRFVDLGLAVAVTEADVRMPVDGTPTNAQLTQQAEWFGELLEGCLDAGHCTSFTLWGAPDRYSWVPVFFPSQGAATPWWDDLSRKPAYDTLWGILDAR